MNKIKAYATLFLVAAGTILGLSLTVANAAVGPGGVAGAIAPDRSASPKLVTLSASQRVTNDAGSTFSAQLKDYAVLDLQYFVSAGDGSNAWLLKLQHSNDGVNWVDGATIGSSLATTANTTDMTRTHNYGGWTRVFFDTTNSTAFTVTVNAVAR